MVGEQQVFRNGMSIARLMHAYSASYRYQDVANWSGLNSFCMHSDWVWGYFINFYRLSYTRPPEAYYESEYLQTYNQSQLYAGALRPEVRALFRECEHSNDRTCNPESTICHYISAARMQELHQLQQQTKDEA